MLPTNTAKDSPNHGALLFLVTYSAAAALLLFSPKSDAYEWLFTPSMRTDLIYTDNITLASGKGLDKKKGSGVIRLIPGLYSKFTSRRFDSEIDFRMRNIIYTAVPDRNRSLINLRTRNTGEIVKNFLFVDGNVFMTQQNQSLLRPGGDDANLTGNLANIRMYSVSPYVRQRFGDLASTEIRYSRILTDSDATTSFFNSQANTYHASLISGTDFRTLEWGLNYSRQDIDFDLRPDTVRIETGIGNIQYNITRRFGLTGTGGYENNEFGGVGQEKPKGVRWSAGFVWLPNKRTSLEASVGQRFFGDTYYFNFTHRRRITAMSAFYREEVRSALNILNLDGGGDTLGLLIGLLTSQAPPGSDPAIIAEAAQILLNELGLPPSLAFAQGFLTNRFFLQKRFQATLGFNTAKNTIITRVFHIKRTPLDFTNPILAVSPGVVGGGGQTNSRQEGVNLTWSHRITARTSLNTTLLYTHRYFPALFRKDDIYMAGLGLSRRFSDNIFGFLSYRYRERRSDDSFSNNAENRVMASLTVRFE
jgi:uncharacterized protein (PEP-CTERM system associated)